MSGGQTVFRVHPAIGIARVGTSPEYYLGPETMAGLPVEGPAGADGRVGGLPIRACTEDEMITSADLRDRNGALKRQGARFRIYAYPEDATRSYPSGQGVEVTIGTEIGGKRVADILWTVHVANKKANSYFLNDEMGIHVYESEHADIRGIRNAPEGPDLDNAARIRRLVIDPGPRAVHGTSAQPAAFDRTTIASYVAADGHVQHCPTYPKSFPSDSFADLYAPSGQIDTLGELTTDASGRLIVLAAYGRSCSWMQPDGTPFPLVGGLIAPGIYGDVNADGWLDDTADGPVDALIRFDDGTVQSVHGGWVIATDPSYAPQTLNVVSLWDDIHDTWIRKLKLRPDIFKSRFDRDYRPHFDTDIHPIFRAAALQRWTTNLPARAIEAHDAAGRISADDAPVTTLMTGLAYIRDPNAPDDSLVGAPFMPLSMGDAGSAFLTVTKTQYFFLSQWNDGKCDAAPPPPLGPGEMLDKAVLINCLGGRFAPGIEMTFVVRDPELYRADWRSSGCGPFRLRGRRMNYAHAQASQPMLTAGYFPLLTGPDGVRSALLEPGDASKFMAVPWQTDYNSCATHPQTPNPLNSTTLYWSWPAQRPVAVHLAAEAHGDALAPQRYSIRGTGTADADPGQQGRWQDLLDSVRHWDGIGFVIQGTAIEGGQHPADQFLEVEGRLDRPEVEPWPTNAVSTDG